MGNGDNNKHTYSGLERPNIRIYSEPPSRMILLGFRVTNAGYVDRLEKELSKRYKIIRRGEQHRNFGREYSMPRQLVIRDKSNDHRDLVVVNFGFGFTEITSAGKAGSRECVEFLTETETLLRGLQIGSGLDDNEIKRDMKAAREKLFSE